MFSTRSEFRAFGEDCSNSLTDSFAFFGFPVWQVTVCLSYEKLFTCCNGAIKIRLMKIRQIYDMFKPGMS